MRTEERCRAYLEALRWPEGVLCPRCESSDTARLEARKKFYCRILPVPLQRHVRDALPQLAPADVEVVPDDLADDPVRGRPAGEPARGAPGCDLQDGVVRRAPRAGRAAGRARRRRPPSRARRGAAHAPASSRGRSSGATSSSSSSTCPPTWPRSQWRTESRENPYAFRDTVLRLLGGDPLAYAQLVGNRGERRRPDRTAPERAALGRRSQRRLKRVCRGRSPCG